MFRVCQVNIHENSIDLYILNNGTGIMQIIDFVQDPEMLGVGILNHRHVIYKIYD